MTLQGVVFVDERGMKFARCANQKAVSGFFIGGQDQNQLSK